MNVRQIIENRLELDADSVWVRPDARPFAYTDGLRSEQYLEQVLTSATDLGSGSRELESRIVDWPSEYHLSPTRAQLLRAFGFDRSQRVLEVGCGCGAISRFLGETFDEVVSVEGSHARARLARLRTRGLDHVAIVQSPFEEVRFKTKFDLVFCIGVFEYATTFVRGDDPHARILDYFADLLNPDGVLVLAIENQLGLKYFCSSGEDHTGTMFEGIEGYPHFPDGARTFGRAELERRLRRRFSEVRFYYPWPDYKVPSLLISEQMLAAVDVSELIGSFRSVDHAARGRRPLFSEELAWHAIARNGLVPCLAPSFLVFAGKSARLSTATDWLGVAYSRRRRASFATVTRFYADSTGAVHVEKTREAGDALGSSGKLQHREWRGGWIDGPSLHLVSARRARARGFDLEQVLEPSKAWYNDLVASSRGGRLEGDRVDSIWRNSFVRDGRCEFIDQEWAWSEPLSLKLVVARGLYYFAQSLLGVTRLGPALRGMTVARFITEAGAIYGLTLTRDDLEELARFESEFLDASSNRPQGMSRSRGELDVHGVLKRRLDSAGSRRVRGLAARAVRRVRFALASRPAGGRRTR